MSDEAIVQAVLAKGAPDSGFLEDDFVTFGLALLAEKKRRDDFQLARQICLEDGGHFFSFLPDGKPAGEIIYENGKTTVSGWRGCDIKCDHCDARLIIRYEEDEK